MMEMTFDDRPVIDALTALEAVGRDALPLMTALGSALVDTTRLRFSTNIAPDGSRWKGLNFAYEAFRRSGPILVQNGALRGSVTFRPGTSEVLIGSTMIYAGVHQDGATIKPKRASALVFHMGPRLIFARQVVIPARPYLGISASDEVMIGEETVAYLGRVLDLA
jgi:phage virion morphogenesis protein